MSDEEKKEKRRAPLHSNIGSLEPVKRGFMNKENPEMFREALEQQSPSFRYFIGNYRDASEFEGKPGFIISNRNKGFVQSEVLEKKRNYLFVAFSCFIQDGRLVFRSFWIVNSNDPMEKLLEDDYGYYDLTETDIPTIVEGFRTGGSSEVIGLNYLH